MSRRRAAVRVLMQQADRNPYTALLAGSLPPEFTTVAFTWSRAILGRYDVLHLHWPDALMRASTPLKQAIRRMQMQVLLARLRLSRAAVVETLHNPSPHEEAPGPAQRLASRLRRRTTWWLVLNRHTPTPEASRTSLTPIGHFRDASPAPRPASATGTLLYFGLIRPYKNLTHLVETFNAAGLPPDLRLRLAGHPQDQHLAEQLTALTQGNPRISLELRDLSDEELADEISAAEMVILPYSRLHNSAAVLLALSLLRPVIVPDTPTMADLRDEVGAAWLITYQGELTPAVLRDAVGKVRATSRTVPPALDARGWPAIGRATADAYRHALSSRHG